MTSTDLSAGDSMHVSGSVTEQIDAVLPEVGDLFYDLHRHPELSGGEVRTAGLVAQALRTAGFEVTTGIGGHGVVGLLENGPGPVVALRADMDALPVREETGLPYASRVVVQRDDGTAVPVMHACGHDVHTACLVGTARVLAGAMAEWRGTLVLIAQPAEETSEGAAAMLADGLFTRFPRPDVVLGQHVATTRAGMVNHRQGTFGAGLRNFRVRITGVGGHGAAPHAAIDPIVTAAQLVVQLQTVVSREINPVEPAVLTVGSFVSGTRPNIIADQATLELTTRAASEEVLEQMQTVIERIAKGVCAAAGADEPVIEMFESMSPVVNHPDLTRRIRAAHLDALAEEDIVDFPAMGMGGEDFALYGVPGPARYEGDPIPTCYWAFGGTAVDVWERTPEGTLLERAMAVPVGHSARFMVDPDPTLRRGVEALVIGALATLAPRPPE